jgi:hypothetical protein
MWRLFDSWAEAHGMAGTGKSTAAEVAARVDTVMTKLLRGERRAAIVQFASKEWDVVERTADAYIAKATKLIEEVIQPRKEYEYALIRQRLEDLYEKTVKADNYQAALSALKQMADMAGVNAAQKVDVTSGGKPLPILITKMDMDKL